jgi:hypothetical protein
MSRVFGVGAYRLGLVHRVISEDQLRQHVNDRPYVASSDALR